MVRSEHFKKESMIEKAMVAIICLILMVSACVWMCMHIMKPTYGRLSQKKAYAYAYTIYIYIYIYIIYIYMYIVISNTVCSFSPYLQHCILHAALN